MHVGQNKVLEDDVLFLHAQEAESVARGALDLSCPFAFFCFCHLVALTRSVQVLRFRSQCTSACHGSRVFQEPHEPRMSLPAQACLGVSSLRLSLLAAELVEGVLRGRASTCRVMTCFSECTSLFSLDPPCSAGGSAHWQGVQHDLSKL